MKKLTDLVGKSNNGIFSFKQSQMIEKLEKKGTICTLCQKVFSKSTPKQKVAGIDGFTHKECARLFLLGVAEHY